MSGGIASTASKKLCTLLLLRDLPSKRILLGLKKKGFGEGKLNGFGGKVEPGETLARAALREMEEESGVVVAPADLLHVGFLNFIFAGREGEELHVHVFSAHAHSGEPRESDEMSPQWVPEAAIPFERMWVDDAHWFPLLLAGKRFSGSFFFSGHSTITKFELAEVEGQERVCPYVGDVGVVLIPQGSKAQGAIDL